MDKQKQLESLYDLRREAVNTRSFFHMLEKCYLDLLAHYLKSDNIDATKAELFQMCADNIELTNKNSDKFIDELTQKIEELEGG